MQPTIDVHKLCKALEESVNSSKEIRVECEQYLKEVVKCDGYIAVLLEIIMSEESINETSRFVGAIFLKNSIKSNYDSLKKEEIQALVIKIYDCMIRLQKKDKIIYTQLREIMKFFMKYKFPNDFTLWDQLLEDINQRSDMRKMYVSLYCLKLVFKRFVLLKKERKEMFNEILNTYYYAVIKCMYDATTLGINNPDVSEILCIVCKIFHYTYEEYVIKHAIIVEYMDNYFSFFDFVLKNEIQVEHYIDDNEYLKKLPQFKLKQIVIDITISFVSRFATKSFNKYNNDLTKALCTMFLEKWLFQYFDDYLLNLRRYLKDKRTLNDECISLIIQCFSCGVENAEVYKRYIKGNIDLLVKEIIFPCLCYTDDDVEKVIYDAYEYAENIFNPNDLGDKASSAKAFLRDLTRYRGEKYLKYLYDFCESILTTYANNYAAINKDFIDAQGNMIMLHNPASVNSGIRNANELSEENQRKVEQLMKHEMCKCKYGALVILSELCVRLCDRKRNIDIEQFLSLCVEQDLTSNNYLICYQSIHVYTYYIRGVKAISNYQRLLRCYEIILHQLSNPHTLVRVASAAYLRNLFKMHNNVLKEAVVKTIPTLIERLLEIIKETKFEYVLSTLDCLSDRYKEYVYPYVNEVVVALSTSYVHLMDSFALTEQESQTGGKGNELFGHLNRTSNNRMTENRYENEIVSKLEKDFTETDDIKENQGDFDSTGVCLSIISTILNLLETIDDDIKEEVYRNTLPYLYAVVDKTIRSENFQHLEEALALLTNITYYLDIDQESYSRFERIFYIYYYDANEVMCQKELEIFRNNPLAALSTSVFFPERFSDKSYHNLNDIEEVNSFLDNIISKKTELFVNMVSNTYGIKYTHMIYRLAINALYLREIQASCKLLCLLFEATIKTKGIDELVQPVLQVVFDIIVKNERFVCYSGKVKKNIFPSPAFHAFFGISANKPITEQLQMITGGLLTIPNEKVQQADADTEDSDIDDDFLSRGDRESVQRLIYSMIIYDAKLVFHYLNDPNRINLLLFFLTRTYENTNNRTRALFVLAMSSILQQMEDPLINTHFSNRLNWFLSGVVNVVDAYCMNKHKKDSEDDKSKYSDSDDSLEYNSEVDLDENEDATNERTAKLMETVENLRERGLRGINQGILQDGHAQEGVFSGGVIDSDDDKEDEYDYDSEDEFSVFSDDDYRDGLFDEINPITTFHDMVKQFYEKYQNMYDEQLFQKVSSLCQLDIEETRKEEERMNKEKDA